MCCGVGNLEVKHSNPRNIYMSTLDQADIDVMRATKTCVAAQRFQYDYLNDDITEDGQIDYNLTGKVPPGLRQAIAEGKKILVLINPPYAEAANSQGNAGKTTVAKTHIGALMNQADYGYAARELFVQFLARIAIELPNATLAMFSTLKYINAPNFEKFRSHWNAKYLGGFVVHSKAFDGLNGNFPIGFLLWQTRNTLSARRIPIDSVRTEVLSKSAQSMGEKCFHNLPSTQSLSHWMSRLQKNDQAAIPLINAITPTRQTLGIRNSHWSNGAIAHFFCNGNDLQNAGTMTAIFSSVHSIGHAGGYFVTSKNLWQTAVMFAARLLVRHSWVNHNDQFLQPSQVLPAKFQTDCLIWMLFHGKNLTASANNLEWNGKKWSLVNHFIPFTETEVGAPDRFESDFMVQYLAGQTLSTEARAVLDAGQKLWRAYFAYTDVRSLRDELKLNRPDVGWYQVRNALKARNASGDTVPVNFGPFEAAYQSLSDKLRPQVFTLGFLR